MAYGRSLELRYNSPQVTVEVLSEQWRTVEQITNYGTQNEKPIMMLLPGKDHPSQPGGGPYRNPERAARRRRGQRYQS